MAGVLIIGAGQAGAEAALALRQNRYDGPITLIGDEEVPPYNRPPLSKDFLCGALPPERLLLRSAAAYERADITLRLGETVRALDPQRRLVHLAGGDALPYSALILATGSRARTLSLPGADSARLMTLRTQGDAERLQSALRPGIRLAIIGAGWLGLEIAASSRKLGCEVAVIEAADRILARSTSPLTAEALSARHRREGVALYLGRGVVRMEGADVLLSDGQKVGADLVVACIGGAAEIALAQSAGIVCGAGIKADADARTSIPDIYAVGDCAEWDCSDGRGAQRLESVQMAAQGARAAAAAICGLPRPSGKMPYFWSQQYDLKLQIAGVVPAGAVTSDTLKGDVDGAFSVTRSLDGKLVAVEAVNSPAAYIEAQRALAQPLVAVS